MKLKAIIPTAKLGSYTIRCAKNGAIYFNRTVCEELGLEVGDKVDFLQDEDSPADFYLKKLSGSLELRAGTTGSLVVNHASFVHKVADAHGVTAPFSIQVSTKPNDECVYALIPNK